VEWNQTAEVVAALLKAGADVKERDAQARTPLMYAADWNQGPGVVTVLLKAGADVKEQDVDGATPLMYAAGVNHSLYSMLVEGLGKSMAENFLKEFDTASGLEKIVASPAPSGSWSPNPGMVSILLKNHADVNAKDKHGNTPLICAAQQKNPQVIILLLKAGADAKAKDSDGKTALDFALKNEHLKGTDAFRQLQRASR